MSKIGNVKWSPISFIFYEFVKWVKDYVIFSRFWFHFIEQRISQCNGFKKLQGLANVKSDTYTIFIIKYSIFGWNAKFFWLIVLQLERWGKVECFREETWWEWMFPASLGNWHLYHRVPSDLETKTLSQITIERAIGSHLISSPMLGARLLLEGFHVIRCGIKYLAQESCCKMVLIKVFKCIGVFISILRQVYLVGWWCSVWIVKWN